MSYEKDGFSLVKPGFKQFHIDYDIYLNIVGLHLDIESLQIILDYRYRNQALEIKACLWQPPENIEAGGWAFGFIPLWLVDVLIPSNVEDITKKFFQTLATGNDGEGTSLVLESFVNKEEKNNILFQADSEVLGNGMVKLGFNLQRKLVTRQKALLTEFGAFKKRLLNAFYQDYLSRKMKRGCP